MVHSENRKVTILSKAHKKWIILYLKKNKNSAYLVYESPFNDRSISLLTISQD